MSLIPPSSPNYVMEVNSSFDIALEWLQAQIQRLMDCGVSDLLAHDTVSSVLLIWVLLLLLLVLTHCFSKALWSLLLAVFIYVLLRLLQFFGFFIVI